MFLLAIIIIIIIMIINKQTKRKKIRMESSRIRCHVILWKYIKAST